MGSLKPTELSKKLSLYLDGGLSPEEARELESTLAESAQAREELEALRRLRMLLANRKHIPSDDALWNRLSQVVKSRQEEERNLLPFPRRYLPAVAGVGIAAFALVAIFAVQYRSSILQFFSEKSLAVRSVYEQRLIKGTILPLFANVDQNQALQFALLGVLPLDARSETVLQVDEKSTRGYRIQVGSRAAEPKKPVTLNSLYTEIRPSSTQKEVIDSLIRFAQRRIGESVLVGENAAMAIDPSLPQVNRLIVSGIAACLDAPQRARFERILRTYDAPYEVSALRATSVSPDRIFAHVQSIPRARKFMIVRPDTVALSEIEFNIDSIQRDVERNAQLAEMRLRQSDIMRRYVAREFRRLPRSSVQWTGRAVSRAGDYLSIDVGREFEHRVPAAFDVVMPRAATGRHAEAAEIEFQFYSDPTNPFEKRFRVFRHFGVSRSGDFEPIDSAGQMTFEQQMVITRQMADSIAREIRRQALERRREARRPSIPPEP